jgi:hypothetical protein
MVIIYAWYKFTERHLYYSKITNVENPQKKQTHPRISYIHIHAILEKKNPPFIPLSHLMCGIYQVYIRATRPRLGSESDIFFYLDCISSVYTECVPGIYLTYGFLNKVDKVSWLVVKL